ncbi:deoxynucleoside kinase [Marinococcus halophilus]|uniref:Deoxyadenosine kinase n=1 Tax=Marinococcus halophilus TaxID=1371 RepID=A0A510YAV8_MARHA|nr:deoxynucleoside kinase [Marinococcus halophilus]OZT78766.1 deoxynucleoside kinase [Marinococcus halophilus]GEK60283.1 deoxyadenosine kinase [Marinococcus halophilus]
MIVVSGMIGIGKTSVAQILGDGLDSKVYYEHVSENPILPLFYKADQQEINEKRYPFLLQLYFLRTRFQSIKQAYKDDDAILDRSIYEDWYFTKINRDLGNINDMEFSVYEGLLEEMMKEIDGLPYKKAPDLNVYLRGSFETVMDRIFKRGRDFEQDEELVEYYRKLWEGYDDWLENYYSASDTLIVDMDKTDVVHNPQDAEALVEQVKDLLQAKNKI